MALTTVSLYKHDVGPKDPFDSSLDQLPFVEDAHLPMSMKDGASPTELDLDGRFRPAPAVSRKFWWVEDCRSAFRYKVSPAWRMSRRVAANL